MTQQDFKNFNLYVTPNGIILWSKLSTDFPFFIMDSQRMGCKVFLSDEMQGVEYHFQGRSLDLVSTAVFTTFILPDGSTHWVVTIPFNGLMVILGDYFPDSIFSQHYKFSSKDFPYGYRNYPSMAFSVGHPE